MADNEDGQVTQQKIQESIIKAVSSNIAPLPGSLPTQFTSSTGPIVNVTNVQPSADSGSQSGDSGTDSSKD